MKGFQERCSYLKKRQIGVFLLCLRSREKWKRVFCQLIEEWFFAILEPHLLNEAVSPDILSESILCLLLSFPPSIGH